MFPDSLTIRRSRLRQVHPDKGGSQERARFLVFGSPPSPFEGQLPGPSKGTHEMLSRARRNESVQFLTGRLYETRRRSKLLSTMMGNSHKLDSAGRRLRMHLVCVLLVTTETNNQICTMCFVRQLSYVTCLLWETAHMSHMLRSLSWSPNGGVHVN